MKRSILLYQFSESSYQTYEYFYLCECIIMRHFNVEDLLFLM